MEDEKEKLEMKRELKLEMKMHCLVSGMVEFGILDKKTGKIIYSSLDPPIQASRALRIYRGIREKIPCGSIKLCLTIDKFYDEDYYMGLNIADKILKGGVVDEKS